MWPSAVTGNQSAAALAAEFSNLQQHAKESFKPDPFEEYLANASASGGPKVSSPTYGNNYHAQMLAFQASQVQNPAPATAKANLPASQLAAEYANLQQFIKPPPPSSFESYLTNSTAQEFSPADLPIRKDDESEEPRPAPEKIGSSEYLAQMNAFKSQAGISTESPQDQAPPPPPPAPLASAPSHPITTPSGPSLNSVPAPIVAAAPPPASAYNPLDDLKAALGRKPAAPPAGPQPNIGEGAKPSNHDILVGIAQMGLSDGSTLISAGTAGPAAPAPVMYATQPAAVTKPEPRQELYTLPPDIAPPSSLNKDGSTVAASAEASLGSSKLLTGEVPIKLQITDPSFASSSKPKPELTYRQQQQQQQGSAAVSEAPASESPRVLLQDSAAMVLEERNAESYSKKLQQYQDTMAQFSSDPMKVKVKANPYAVLPSSNEVDAKVQQAADHSIFSYKRVDAEADRQLKNILQDLSSSAPSDVEKAAMAVARMASSEEGLYNLLSHPSVDGALVRLMANVEAFDRFAAAACLSALRFIAADPTGRRRLLDPKQYLGVRPPESCVESMFVGMAAALRSPDANMVCHAVSAISNLLIAQAGYSRVMALPDSAFRELVTGLVEVMGAELSDNTAADDASNALCGLLQQGESRVRLLDDKTANLEQMLSSLTAIMQPGAIESLRKASKEEFQMRLHRASNATHVLAAITQDLDGQVKLMTRHNSLGCLVDGLAGLLRSRDHTIVWNATTVIHNMLSCKDLCDWLMLRPPLQVSALLAGVFHCLMSENVNVLLTSGAIVRCLCVATPQRVLSISPDLLVHMCMGICRHLCSNESQVAENAAIAVGFLVESEGAAHALYKPSVFRPHLQEILGGLVRLLQSSMKGVILAASGALVRMLRGPHGEELLHKTIVPYKEPETMFGLWVTRLAEPVPDNQLPLETKSFIDNLVAGLLVALNCDHEGVGAECTEVLCIWAGIPNPAWTRLLGQEEAVIVRLLSGTVKLLWAKDTAASRNAVILLHCFTLDERGQAFLSLMEPPDLKLFLKGLRSLRANATDQAASDLAGTALNNLEDFGPPCWRRWLQALDLEAPIVQYSQWENPQQTLKYANSYLQHQSEETRKHSEDKA